MVEKLNKVVHVERALVQQLGRQPTTGEIATELEYTAREVRDILRIAQQPVSLEKPIGDEQQSELGDFLEDETAESPFELASEHLRREHRALATLPVREREVIEMRFGLTGSQPQTLEEVGQAFSVTRERIRQIENHTLKKLDRGPTPARRELTASALTRSRPQAQGKSRPRTSTGIAERHQQTHAQRLHMTGRRGRLALGCGDGNAV